MRIAIAGSIATDHLMQFPGRFADQLLAHRLDTVSLSFLVDRLEVRRGGVGANIAFGLGQLGLEPVLVGAAGVDFADYQVWLKRHGVIVDHVRISDTRRTARFICTTDTDQNQIATFYAGAMSEAREIDLGSVARAEGVLDLVVVAPDDPAAMIRHTEYCRRTGTAFAADPSQQLARLDRDQVRTLVEGARFLFGNQYEAGLLAERAGWTEREVLSRVGTWITTLGPAGVVIRQDGQEPVTVQAVPTGEVADPTGVGDGFRAGFLAGTAWGLPLTRAAQLGCVMATTVLETVGTQEYTLSRDRIVAQIGRSYGPLAARDIETRRAGAK